MSEALHNRIPEDLNDQAEKLLGDAVLLRSLPLCEEAGRRIADVAATILAGKPLIDTAMDVKHMAFEVGMIMGTRGTSAGMDVEDIRPLANAAAHALSERLFQLLSTAGRA